VNVSVERSRYPSAEGLVHDELQGAEARYLIPFYIPSHDVRDVIDLAPSEPSAR
jgi:hypothetical protein